MDCFRLFQSGVEGLRPTNLTLEVVNPALSKAMRGNSASQYPGFLTVPQKGDEQYDPLELIWLNWGDVAKLKRTESQNG